MSSPPGVGFRLHLFFSVAVLLLMAVVRRPPRAHGLQLPLPSSEQLFSTRQCQIS